MNLIGEHTDYNDGYVMPVAIGLSCWVAAAPRAGEKTDQQLVIYSENFDETAHVNLNDIPLRASQSWSDYPVGVAWALQQAGFALAGANIFMSSEVPMGAGLASSAALEVSVAWALLALSGFAVDGIGLAQLCRQAENDFVGTRCGIMDQFASCQGRVGHALMLDCRSLEYRPLPLPASSELIICNTNVKHALSAGKYNVRRAECEEGVRALAEFFPGIRALRDVTLENLQQHRARMASNVYKRCRHVITENDRVLRAARALEAGDTILLGRLMGESHRSLRNDFEVSCRELDVMVDLANKQRGTYGARMTGGGFGGCTINVVNRGDAPEFVARVTQGYRAATGREANCYICEASQGAEEVLVPAGTPAGER